MKLSVFLLSGLTASLLLASAALASAHTMVASLDQKDIKSLAAAAEGQIEKAGLNGTIVIVDADGQLLYVDRLDGSIAGSIDAAIGKARTSALYHTPSATFMDRLAKGQNVALAVPNALPMGGGYPLTIGNTVVGAIGISTPKPDMDITIAQTTAETLK